MPQDRHATVQYMLPSSRCHRPVRSLPPVVRSARLEAQHWQETPLLCGMYGAANVLREDRRYSTAPDQLARARAGRLKRFPTRPAAGYRASAASLDALHRSDFGRARPVRRTVDVRCGTAWCCPDVSPAYGIRRWEGMRCHRTAVK